MSLNRWSAKVSICFILGVLFISRTASAQSIVYGWMLGGGSSSHQADQNYSVNSRGGVNSVTRTALGEYIVTFPELGRGPNGGNVQIGSFGDGGGYCKVVYWYPDEASSLIVRVNCFNFLGQSDDGSFAVTYTMIPGVNGQAWGAYGWNFFSDSDGSLDGNYAMNSSDQSTYVQHVGTGEYMVYIYGQDFSSFLDGTCSTGPTALVTAYGYDSSYCNVGAIYSSGDTGIAGAAALYVTCYKSAINRVPADSLFTYSFGVARTFFAPAQGYYTSAGSGTQLSANIFIESNEASRFVDVTRTSTGRYTVFFPGMTRAGHQTVAIVTAVNSWSAQSADRCNATGWDDAPTGGSFVNVSCYRSAILADGRFNIVFGSTESSPQASE